MLSTRTRFEKVAKGNSEMVYSVQPYYLEASAFNILYNENNLRPNNIEGKITEC